MNVSQRHDDSRFSRSGTDLTVERDELKSRVRSLESALARIGREAEVSLMHPETSFIAVHRIASVTRQAAKPAEAPPPPPASTRRRIVHGRWAAHPNEM